MNQNTIIILIVLGMALIFGVITVIAVKRAGNSAGDEAVLQKALTGLGYAQSLAAAITPFLPGVAGTVITKVLTYAQQAVTRAEATYKVALSTDANADDMRTTEAVSMIKSVLALDGVTETDQIDKLINTVIPMLVLALPKTHAATADSTGAAQAAEVKQDTAGSAESGAVASGTTGAA